MLSHDGIEIQKKSLGLGKEYYTWLLDVLFMTLTYIILYGNIIDKNWKSICFYKFIIQLKTTKCKLNEY